MQLISYCLLIEETKGTKPKYSFIQYKIGKPFAVPYTEGRKLFLIKTIQEMRGYIDLGESPKPVRNSKCEKCRHKEDRFW